MSAGKFEFIRVHGSRCAEFEARRHSLDNVRSGKCDSGKFIACPVANSGDVRIVNADFFHRIRIRMFPLLPHARCPCPPLFPIHRSFAPSVGLQFQTNDFEFGNIDMPGKKKRQKADVHAQFSDQQLPRTIIPSGNLQLFRLDGWSHQKRDGYFFRLNIISGHLSRDGQPEGFHDRR